MFMGKFHIIVLILCVSPFVLAQQTSSAPAPAPIPFPTPTPTVTLSDAQVAEILVTINEAEIEAAKMAKSHAKSNEVQDYAKMMKNEHEVNKAETKKLAKKQDFGMKDSDLEDLIEDEAEASNKNLKKNKNNFDKVYIDQQIKMHEKALTTIKETLLPNTKNPALKEHLMNTQKAVTAHLEHARAVQIKLQ